MRPPGGAYLRYPNTSSVSHIHVSNPPANVGGSLARNEISYEMYEKTVYM